MLHQDYLMRMILALAQAITNSIEKSKNNEEDWEASAELLEAALANATEIDGSLLLRLDAQSMTGLLQLSQTDPVAVEYIARTLLLESEYLTKAHKPSTAALREEQAFTLAQACGIPLSKEDISPEELDAFFEKTQEKYRI
ncbi:MAG: hypothetical protein ACI4BI_04510 [Anaerotardibacter sp.]